MHVNVSPTTPAEQRWRDRVPVRLAWNVGIAVGGVMLARLLGTVTQVVLAGRMTLDDYGRYTALYTLLGVAIILSGLGLDTWLLRQSGSPDTLREQTHRVVSLRLFATITLIVLGGALLLITDTHDMTWPLVLAAGLALTGEQLLTTAYAALRAQVRNHATALLQVVASGTFIGLLWLWSNNGTIPVIVAAVCRLIAASLGVALMIWLLHDRLRLLWAPRDWWRLCMEARVYFAADLLANVTLKADLTMITLLIGTTAAGLYNPALTIINTTFIVPSVAAQVLLPIIVRPNLPRRDFRLIVAASVLGSLLYGLFWFVLLTWQSASVIDLIFPSEFLAAAPLLQIMALIPLMKSLNFCTATIMVARDAQLLRTKLQAAGAVANLVGNLLLIPLLGLMGAAWVNVITEVVLLFSYGWGAWTTRRPRA